MPSSRGSSPLSSATPSPPPDAGPSDLALEDSSNSISSLISRPNGLTEHKRDARSPTSSTAVKSNFSDDDGDESELTEEDEEDGVNNEATGDLVVKKELVEGMSQDIGDLDDEPLSAAEELSERSLSPESENHRSMRSSPSLTPPPPSGGMQIKRLPDLIREPVSTATSEGSQDEDEADDDLDDLDVIEQDQDVDSDRNLDEEDHEPSEEGDGDDASPARSVIAPEAPSASTVVDHDGDGTMLGDKVDQSEVAGGSEEMAEQLVPEINVDAPEALEGEQPTEDILPEEQDKAEADNENDASDTPSVPLPSRPSHPSHAPPPSSAHLRALLILEVKFAALRDKLYVERMEEAAAEEHMILDGTHPALRYLYKTLAGRRERLHEAASKRHEEAMRELKRARESDKGQTWSCWTEERDQLQWEEFEATWSKRRRLAREKNEIETVRYVKPIPKAGGKGRSFDWTAGASPAKASEVDIAKDLAALDARNLQSIQLAQQQQVQHMSRHASPAMFTAPMQPQAVPAAYNNPSTTLSSAISGASISRPPVASQAANSYAYNNMPHTYNPPRPVPVHNVHSGSSQLLSAGPSRPTTQARPQGRTVPTTSDLFDTGRKDAVTPGSLPWMKSDGMRPVNGHSAPTNAPPSATKPDEPQHSRFPGLAEYLSSTRPPNNVNSATTYPGYGGILNGGSKILSPPKQPTGGLLGAFGARPPGSFGATASATTAGTNLNRLP